MNRRVIPLPHLMPTEEREYYLEPAPEPLDPRRQVTREEQAQIDEALDAESSRFG